MGMPSGVSSPGARNRRKWHPRALSGAVGLSDRFCRDVGWNLGSVAVLAVCGFALNIVIGRFYGAAVFGVFSQVLAVYYIFSQLAVGGFVFSTLNFTASHGEDREAVRRIIASALWLTAGLASVVCGAAFFMAGWIGRLFASDGIRQGLLWVLPGLWCFALNKVLLMALNGLRHMRAYAVFTALRYALMLGSVVGLTLAGADAGMLPLCLALGEIVLLPLLAGYLFRLHPPAFQGLRPWFGRHLHFGGYAFFSGLLMDVNLKVDVILLGYFLSDRVVGVYNFAAMLAIEGLYQIVVVVQMNMNPLLSRLKKENLLGELRRYVRRAMMILSPALAVVSCVIAWLYPMLTLWLTGSRDFVPGRLYFMVLMAGIVIGSSHLPFLFVLNQWGHPGWFTLFLLAIVTTNFFCNWLLIPLWGALGSALGTGLTYALTGIELTLFLKLSTGAGRRSHP